MGGLVFLQQVVFLGTGTSSTIPAGDRTALWSYRYDVPPAVLAAVSGVVPIRIQPIM